MVDEEDTWVNMYKSSKYESVCLFDSMPLSLNMGNSNKRSRPSIKPDKKASVTVRMKITRI